MCMKSFSAYIIGDQGAGTIDESRPAGMREQMPLVTSREILQKAFREGYAVGGFNAHNLETLRAVVEAAEQERAPVIVQLSRGSIEYAGLDLAATLIKAAARGATVPVVLHLDHGMSLEIILRCLRAGFTSLMFDGTEILLRRHLEERDEGSMSAGVLVDRIQSREAFEANLEMTGRVVEISHACGIPVEAELGKIPRFEDFRLVGIETSEGRVLPESAQQLTRQLYAVPEMAEEFVRSAGCDSLAVACGSVHGMNEALRSLDIAALERIAERTDVPLVLHGSSGVIRTGREARERGLRLHSGEGSIEDAIKAGVAKVNISTELQVTYLQALRRELAEHPEQRDMRKLFPPATEAVKKRVVSFMRLFGSAGRV
jgi:fructose-bisphosphate aldolase class II